MDLPLSTAACVSVGAPLLWRAASGSTNSDLVSRAARAAANPADTPLADLTVIATDTQTAGRGRLDRAWSTPPGVALAVSVFVAHEPAAVDVPLVAQDRDGASGERAPHPAPFPPVDPARSAATRAAIRPSAHPPAVPRRLGWLPLLAGVAMAGAVRGLGVPSAGVKWPNDVLVDGRKISGILTELTPSGVVIGAGLNLSTTADQLPVSTATSLTLEGVPNSPSLLDRALAAYLGELFDLVARWRASERPGELGAIVVERLQTLGRAVRVDLPGHSTLRGMATGLDDDGRLLVRPMSAGAAISAGAKPGLIAVAAGDVTHLRYE
jgi:BirA family biotin operon repressor/biotin-[acetyl-CoA-carboxylase] ligase